MRFMILCVAFLATSCAAPLTPEPPMKNVATVSPTRSGPPTSTPLPYHDVGYIEGVSHVLLDSGRSKSGCVLYIRFESSVSASPSGLSEYRFRAYYSPDIQQWRFPWHELGTEISIGGGSVGVIVAPKLLRRIQAVAMGRQAGVRLEQRGRYRNEQEWRSYYSDPVPVPQSFYSYDALLDQCESRSR